ncbi:adenosine deaminase [Profundibacterium mesophilum]|uniref:Adenosine deaminase n=1 Tax=Profundibacterium mesophilum KAUST100406-0324 TaxID=1037889 RepID=A0A921NXI9_9RHOB|nr:adenosine deaminase [Profundibacterium mesophilum]KAF0677230.1 Adenosine deaminase [Profundibacterium mesophilum KAUST100406-0324]
MAAPDLPKIELHLHIEGAAPPAFIRGLAAEQGVDLSAIFTETGAYRFAGFADFLRVYEAATSVLRGPAEFARLTRAVLEQSAREGVIYTELFVSPDFCGGRDLGAWRDYLGAIDEAAQQIEAQGGPMMRVIATPIRHFGPEAARETARVAAETAGARLTGFGIGGDENAGELGDFAWAFDCAREAGLGLTAHAGEWRGPSSIRDALALGCTRIGHGVRAIEDPRLVEDLAEKEITLEICPGSNVALGVYRSLREHPVERLRAAGVPVTISTDDPPFFHTALRQEYDQLAHVFGWDEGLCLEVNETAARAAFCDAPTREALLKAIAAAR